MKCEFKQYIQKVWSVHVIINTSGIRLAKLTSLTLHEIRSLRDYMNIPKIEFMLLRASLGRKLQGQIFSQ